MATMDIGGMRLSLTIGDAEFRRGLTRAEAALDRFAQRSQAQAAALTKGFVAAFAVDRVVSGFVEAIRKVVVQSEQLRRVSESTGVGITALSQLQFAAEQTGVPFETLQKVIEQFGARFTEFAANPASKGAVALQAIGLSARDASGQLQSFEQLLPRIADRFSSYADGANKSAIASALFGEEGGPKMARLLSQGSAGLKAFGDESDRLRLTITPDAAAKLKVFEDAAKSLERSSRSLALEMATGLAPALKEVASMFAQIVNGAPRLNEISTDKLNQRLVLLEENAVRLHEQLAIVGSSLKKDQSAELARTEKQIMLTHDLIRARALLAQPAAGEQPKLEAPDLAGEIERRKAAIDGATLSTQLYNEKLREQAAFTEALRTPLEEYEAALQRIAALQGKKAISAETAARGEQKAQLDLVSTYVRGAAQVTGTLASAFQKNKAFAVANAVANVAEGITGALKLPFPLNWAQAAAVSAAGVAQIAAIRSAQPSGGGAAPRVSGGGSAAGAAAASTPAAQNSTLFVQGISPTGMFTGEVVRELAGKLLAYQRDGGRVVLAGA